MAKKLRCVGGCGKTKEAAFETKAKAPEGFTTQTPWMCEECKVKAPAAQKPVAPPAAPASGTVGPEA